MARTVRLPDSLVQDAKTMATSSMRSVPKQIEYYYTLGKIAEDNPDLPMTFIKDVLAAKAEIDAGNISPFSFEE
ncbi:MAG: TA system antitoxin ParD family protein [Micavibrio sp.]